MTGKLTIYDTTQVIADVYTAVVNASNTTIIYATGQTDSAGNFSFADVNSTDGVAAYRIHVIADGYYDGFSDAFRVDPATLAFAPVIVIALNPLPGTTFHVFPGMAHLSGRIKWGNGQGMPGATVTIISVENMDKAYASAMTDSDGNYTLDASFVSAEPAFQLRVQKDGYVDAYSVSFSLSTSASVVVNLVHNNAVPTVPPTPTPTPYPASPGTGHVSGRIKMGNGQGLYGATVTVIKAGNLAADYGSATTDSYGFFNLDTSSVSAEPVFQLLVRKDGYQDVYSVSFSLASGASITINVNDNSMLATPTQTPTLVPSPTPVATPILSQGTDQVITTPRSSETTVTVTPVPCGSSTPRPTPGFETVIALTGIVMAAACIIRKKI